VGHGGQGSGDGVGVGSGAQRIGDEAAWIMPGCSG